MGVVEEGVEGVVEEEDIEVVKEVDMLLRRPLLDILQDLTV